MNLSLTKKPLIPLKGNVNDPNPIEFYSYIQEGKIYYNIIN